MTEFHRRAGFRGYITRIIKTIEELLSDPACEVSTLDIQLKILKNQREKIDSLDEVIQSSFTESSELQKDMDESFMITSKIENSIYHVERKLSSLKMQSQSQVSTNTPSEVKLPILKLPSFSGGPLEWPHFWDTFRSSVDARKDLTGAQKFSYLVGQLKEEALQLLEGFTMTDLHYVEAIKLLKNTYGKPNKIIQAHLHAIFDLKCSSASSKDLSKFRASYECHIRGLNTMQTNVDGAGFVLAALLIRKLPSKIRDNINRASNSDVWTLDSLRKAIDREIELIISVEPEICTSDGATNKVFNNFPKLQNFKPNYGSKQKSTAGTFNISAKKEDSNCKFCSGIHFTSDCDNYNSAKDRKERARELRLCFNCLSNSHGVFACGSLKLCRHCKRKHHSSLCFKSTSEVGATSKSTSEVGGTSSEKSVDNSKSMSTVAAIKQFDQESKSTALPTGILPIISNGTVKRVRALFDQGSQRTFVLQSTTTKLHVKPTKKIRLCIDGFQSKGREQDYDVVELIVDIAKGIRFEAVVVTSLPSRITICGITDLIECLESDGVRMADCNIKGDIISNVEILVGADHFYKFVYGQTMCQNVNLLASCFGMMVTGPLPDLTSGMTSTVKCISTTEVATVLSANNKEIAQLDEEIHKLWSLDSIGIGIINEKESSLDEQVLSDFEKNIEFKNGHYAVSLPWKINHRDLKSNFGLANGRLRSTLLRLKRKPEHLSAYDKIIRDYMQKKFIEKVPDEELKLRKHHYLSHHGVERPSATTPLRIVFDCSAGDPSLNDCLNAGPSLINELGKVILRFRVERYAFISDISKAFLMINIKEEDRNSTCFLWPEDPWSDNSKLTAYRFRVVLFGATCSPFLLNATLLHHIKLSGSSFAMPIQRNLYVDNLHGCTQTESALVDFYTESKRIFHKANFILREWATNSELLQRKIDVAEEGMEEKQDVKFLGMKWKIKEDFIFCKGPDLSLLSEQFTKRNVLSRVSRIFDPLGLLTPVSIRTKIFMQELWKRKLGWDELISNSGDYNIISSILNDLQTAANVGIPRQIAMKGNVALHAFSDASAKAYGVVIYATSEGKSTLIISKARVAPLKELTIPKLELAAATLATRLISYVLEAYSDEIKFETINFWTDSKVVLSWIATNKELKSFEKSRIQEIKKTSCCNQWRYVNTNSNPADCISRGITARKFILSTLWFHGPSWLPNETSWPTEDVDESDSVTVNAGYAVTTAVTNAEEETSSEEHQAVLSIDRFSSLKKLLRTTAIVMKFVDLSKVQLENRQADRSIDANDIIRAKHYWIQQAQKETYCEELKYLKSQKIKQPNLVHQLNLFLHEGILRCHGRIDHAELDWNSKYPILLPSKHKFTRLIILEAHSRIHHAGTSSVISKLRQEVWIPKMRQQVKSILRICVVCKKIQGKPYKVVTSPPLPEERVKEAKPFTVTGIDYTGALLVKNGEKIQKAYIVLFTCAITRAIHLEIVTDNTSDTFIRAFKRFISRRSCPRLLMSDNSLTFVAAAKFLKKLQEDLKTKSMLADLSCEWKFIPSRAPWYGGYWERMIALTKTSLKKVLGQAIITLEELQTLVVEIECAINDRPITYASDDIDDLGSLTPSELLYGHKLNSFPDPEEDSDPNFNEPNTFTARQRAYAKTRSHFWKRWRHEYLLSLRERSLKVASKGEQVINVGDMVIVHNNLTPRLHWKLGRVTKLNYSADGLVRSVLLKTATGEISRAISRLYPLEITATEMTHKKKEKDTVLRPVRQAAIEARKRIANQVN